MSLPPSDAKPEPDGLWKGFLLHLSLVLLIFIMGIFLGIFFRNEDLLAQQNLTKAQACFESILMARRWNADFHGVFVEKTPGVESNPYLPDPDRAGPDGRAYTLKNPALMLREISQYGLQQNLFQFRITSLRPLNPRNAPDVQERKGLEDLARGQAEAYWKEATDGSMVFRYLAPLKVEQSCLVCHTTQGYQVGDVIGGVTVSFDIGDLEQTLGRQRLYIWLLALGTILNLLAIVFLLVRRLRSRVRDLQMALQEQAVRDALTGLFNRRHLHAVLEDEIQRAQRYGHPLSLLMIDVDRFKKINDSLGHQTGDQVLKQVAQTIKNCCRHSDTLARYGGEEFVVLAPHTALPEARLMAEKIRAEVEHHAFSGREGQPLAATVSIGVAELGGLPGPAERQADQLLAAADEAMYRAKQNGRNRVETA